MSYVHTIHRQFHRTFYDATGAVVINPDHRRLKRYMHIANKEVSRQRALGMGTYSKVQFPDSEARKSIRRYQSERNA